MHKKQGNNVVVAAEVMMLLELIVELKMKEQRIKEGKQVHAGIIKETQKVNENLKDTGAEIVTIKKVQRTLNFRQILN